MATRDEEEIWRSIVENYGERAVLDGPPGPSRTADVAPPVEEPRSEDGAEPVESAEIDPHHPEPPRPSSRATGSPAPAPGQRDMFGPAPRPHFTPFESSPTAADAATPDLAPDDDLDPADASGRFVPPTPPLPTMDRARWMAWIGVLGGPAGFVLAAVANQNLSGFTALLLALAFIGGFGWLVFTMPQEPRDPWDDGARV